MLAAAPIALVGFLGKENTVLMPLLLLVCEFTLLRKVTLGPHPARVRLIQVGYIVLPLVIGIAYVVTHPGLLSYEGRAFTLEQRLMTQPRVLWTYLQWLFVPNITAFGLFHDDLVLSTGWVTPPTTLIAVAGWCVTFVAAILLRARAPVFAFAVLFYLANHALESTVFSSLGLPAPHNETALHQCLDAVAAHGAVPAVTAIIDGVAVRAGEEVRGHRVAEVRPDRVLLDPEGWPAARVPSEMDG